MAKLHGPIFRQGRRRLGIDDEQAQARAISAGKISFQAVTHGSYLGDRLDDCLLPGLSSAGSWDATMDQDWGVPLHRNEGIEIVFLETGRATFGLEGASHELMAYQGTVTSPWQAHRLGGPHLGPGRLHWLILDVGVRRTGQIWRWPSWVCLAPNDLANLAQMLQQGAHPVWQGTERMAGAFREMAQAIGPRRRADWGSRLAIVINQILLELLAILRAGGANPVSAPGHRARVDAFLQRLAADPALRMGEWPVERMANACGLGISAFTATCRSLTNQSPLQHLTGLILERAGRRLRAHPELPVTSIALDAGFSSGQYFARLFRRHYRCTALAYRKG